MRPSLCSHMVPRLPLPTCCHQILLSRHTLQAFSWSPPFTPGFILPSSVPTTRLGAQCPVVDVLAPMQAAGKQLIRSRY